MKLFFYALAAAAALFGLYYLWAGTSGEVGQPDRLLLGLSLLAATPGLLFMGLVIELLVGIYEGLMSQNKAIAKLVERNNQ